MKLSMDEIRYFADLELEQIQELLVEWGEPKYRATQIWQGFYKHLHASPEEIPNLPRALRQRLAESFSFSHLNLVNLIHSTDGETSKTLFELPDAQAIEAIEATVVLPGLRRWLALLPRTRRSSLNR